MKTVGITGGIGSGKTTVCEIFQGFGIPVFTTDLEARKLLFVPKIRKKIFRTFGEAVMLGDKISSLKLANVVFKDSEKLKKLNAIIHPETLKMFARWAKQYKTKSYVIMESALLFESGIGKKLDYIITVTAPEKVRIKRVKARNGMNVSEIRRRMGNQLGDAIKVRGSDFVIVNDGKRELKPQVMRIYTKLAKIK